MKISYVIGVYQSKVRNMNPDALMITSQNRYVVDVCKEILEKEFNRKIYQKITSYPKGSIVKYKQRLVFWNKKLMTYLREITDNNTKVPSNADEDYIRGWMDSRAIVTFSPHHINCLDWETKYPRVVIHKNNQILLQSLKRFLRRYSFYPTINKDRLVLSKNKDIQKLIKKGLITDKDKLEKLVELDTELKIFQEIR